jgi:hypothetical protein
MEYVAMNINTICLKTDRAGIEMTKVGTVLTRSQLMRILACCLIAELSVAVLLWLGMMLIRLAHLSSAAF